MSERPPQHSAAHSRALGCLCVLALAGCLASTPSLELRSAPEPVASARANTPGGLVFGRWLEVAAEPSVSAELEQACLLEQQGASEDAAALLGRALRVHPGCDALFAARGALYVSMGYLRAGAADFECAVDLSPERARNWFALGHTYARLSLPRQALRAFEQAANIGEADGRLLLALAREYGALGRRGQAARHCELALGRHEPEVVELLVEALVLAREDRGSIEATHVTLESCRGCSSAASLRTLVRQAPPGNRQALTDFVQALGLGPEELADLTAGLLTILELSDVETRASTRERLLADEPDEAHRAELAHYLAAE